MSVAVVWSIDGELAELVGERAASSTKVSRQVAMPMNAETGYHGNT